jgi:hypothetical protein
MASSLHIRIVLAEHELIALYLTPHIGELLCRKKHCLMWRDRCGGQNIHLLFSTSDSSFHQSDHQHSNNT